MDRPFTEEEMKFESERFHMLCSYCGILAIPQLMPLDPMVYVKLFIEKHSVCYLAKR